MTEAQAKRIVLSRFPRACAELGGYGYWRVKTRGKGPGYLFCSGKTEAEAWVVSAGLVQCARLKPRGG